MRWIARIVVALIIVVVAAGAALFLLPADKIAGLVADQFKAATGRELTLEGDVRPTLWPELGINTGAVSIANADWSKSGPMLTATRLSIGVNIGALLGGDIRINRIEAEAPQVLLETSTGGRGNWEFGGTDAGTGTARTAPSDILAFTLDKAVINGGALTFVDHGSGSKTTMNDVDLTVRLPDASGGADISLAARMNGQPFSAKGTIASFATFLSQGAVPVAGQLRAGGSVLDFDGRAGLSPMAAGGRIALDLADKAAVFGLVGMGAPDLPPGLGQKIAINGDFTLTDTGGVTLRDSTVRLDQNNFQVAADIVFADRPRIKAKVSAGALDFSALFGDSAGGGEAAAGASTGWSRDLIDVTALQTLDADVSLNAASIDLGLAKLGTTRVITTLDSGRAVTEIKELVAYGGTVSGSFVVNSRGGLSARSNLTGKSVALQPLLQQLAGYDRLLGVGDLTLNLLGVGNDMHTLMNSLSGDGAIKIGKGELRGLDLAGMLRNLDVSYVGEGAKTIFDGISATFVVNQGVLRNDDMRLVAPLLTASGQGTVGIGTQSLDYQVVPTLLEGQTNGGLKVPLMITGSWADPKFNLDLKALAEQELTDEVEELREKAEEVVIDKLEEELGVKVESLNNIEETLTDELKEELEDRVRDGLLDLLGGN